MPYTQYQRLRVDVGFAPDDTLSLPDEQIDDAYERANLLYTATTSVEAAARVIVLEQLYAAAVTSTDYTQNNSTEKASQLFDHYGKLLDKWNGALKSAISAAAVDEAGSVFSGHSVRKPPRYKEFPGGGWSWDIQQAIMIPTSPLLARRITQRAERAVRRIGEKPTSVVFRTALRVVTISAQTVRLEFDNRSSAISSAAGAAPRTESYHLRCTRPSNIA